MVEDYLQLNTKEDFWGGVSDMGSDQEKHSNRIKMLGRFKSMTSPLIVKAALVQ